MVRNSRHCWQCSVGSSSSSVVNLIQVENVAVVVVYC